MGVVYAGQHVTTGRMVAVKILHSQLIANEELVHRFIREAQAEVAINHKNVIDVLDLGGLPTGEPFMVMEYLTGAGLDEIISARGHLDLPTACAIMEPTLHAIGAAHEKGVVHRDLKPENVFINQTEAGDVEIKLIDFGISKIQNQDVTKLTQEGTTLGTPAYMSPEQVRGATDTSHLTDIYAAGIIFYEMLCGDTPFEGQHYAALLANVLTSEPRNPRKLNKKFPMAAWPVIQKAISKDATERYQSSEEMLLAVLELSDEITRARGLSTLPAVIMQATGNKSIPPRYDVGQNQGQSQKDANEILSDLAQQNSEMAAKTILSENAAINDAPDASDATKETVSVGANTLLGRLKNATFRRTHSTTSGALDLQDPHPIASEPIEEVETRRSRKGMGGITAFVIIVGIALLAYGVFNHYDAEEQKDDNRVSIEIVGAPKHARIFYKDEVVAQNPFEVDKGERWTPVRVVTGERTRMRFVVIPSRDMRIQYVPGGRKAELIEADSEAAGIGNSAKDKAPLVPGSQPAGEKFNSGVSKPAAGSGAHKNVVKDAPKPAAKPLVQSKKSAPPAKKAASPAKPSTSKRATVKKTGKTGATKKTANRKKSSTKNKKTTQKKKKPAKTGAKKNKTGTGKKRKNPFKRLENRLKRTFGD